MDSRLAERLQRVARKQTLQLTHYGRKSGQPHQVTIWFMVDGESIFLATANVDRHWVKNVKQTPHVKMQVGAETFEGAARFIESAEEHRQVMARMREKYWMVRPLFALGKVLTGLGWVTDHSGSFEVTINPH